MSELSLQKSLDQAEFEEWQEHELSRIFNEDFDESVYDVKDSAYTGEEITQNRLKSKYWRMNNLYKIVDKDGNIVQFKMNEPQEALFNNLWYKNIMLKARQQGFTTFTCIYYLDECLFNDNVEAGIIAHTKPDASEIFRRKIQFPYENLPPEIKEIITLETDSKVKMEFSNGAVISVGTSMRSATLQYLLISELGKIAKKYPEKAREIMSGALEAVGSGDTIVCVESTGEGRSGAYYDLCDTAMKHIERGSELTSMDFKFNFFPWFDCSDYQLDAPVAITKEMKEYFANIEAEIGMTRVGFKLSQQQKAWYIKKRESLGDDVKREYPATPDEAFESGIEGTYYKTQFRKMREQGRITRVPHHEGIVVDTWWDLGMNDSMTIWFTQDVGREIHVINYYENSGEGFEFYADIMSDLSRDYGYHYGRHVAPHDIKVREIGPGISRLQSAADLGIRFEVAPKIETNMDGVQKTRSILSICYFDDENCSLGLDHLEEYRKKWDDINGVFKDQPVHDEHSHGAKGFETMAVGHDFRAAATGEARSRAKAKPVRRRPAGGWT